MEYGTIEREIHIDASPEVVFEVLSRPEHLREWWPDEAVLEPTPGSTGEVVFGDRQNAEAVVVPVTVLEVAPPRRFAFRWTQPEGEVPGVGNSLLVTFELTPAGNGTHLRMTEEGFREMGWEVATLEATYHDHEEGWDHHLGRLVAYADRLVSVR